MNEEQHIKQLPKGWKWVKLGEVAIYLNGRAFKPTEWRDSGKPIIRIQNLNKPDAKYNYTKEQFEDKYKVINGDLLFAWSASLGAYIWKGDEAWLNQHIFKVVPRDFTNKKYLFYLLEKIVQELYAKAHGSGLVHVTKGKFEATEIPFPPLPTQLAIVSKIEELFSELDKGIENLRTAQQQLKTYRQAVLKWAFEGKLTNSLNHDAFDANDENELSMAAEPTVSYHAKNNKCSDKGELPKGWEWVLLGEVSKVSGGLTKNAKRQSLELQLPFLRVGNVYFNHLDLNEMHTIGINKTEIERVKLIKDDLLFVEGNGSLEQIGRVALWNGAIENCVHQNHLIKARLSNRVIPKYALYFFCSKSGRDKIKEQANSTSGLHTLSLGKISKLAIPLCTIEEQNKIVEEIETRLSIADKMEESISQSLQQAEALRQSILKKAFEGKLV